MPNIFSNLLESIMKGFSNSYIISTVSLTSGMNSPPMDIMDLPMLLIFGSTPASSAREARILIVSSCADRLAAADKLLCDGASDCACTQHHMSCWHLIYPINPIPSPVVRGTCLLQCAGALCGGDQQPARVPWPLPDRNAACCHRYFRIGQG